MRLILYKLILILSIVHTETYGQNIIINPCDSNRLTKQEFEKCSADSAWDKDIVIKTNYITNLKTDLLPKYRKVRAMLTLSTELLNLLRNLKTTYDTVLNIKLATFLDEMDKTQKYVQPKTYLSTLLSFQTFKFYPDVYAILLNDIHLQLKPTTSIVSMNTYNKLVEDIHKIIPTDLYQRLEKITRSFDEDNKDLKKNSFAPMFQGTQTQEELKKYRIINFLLWTD